MEKVVKERIFYLDFIRAIAVIVILITHYNAGFVFGREVPMFDKCVITEFPFGIYVGDFGVSLFLIISGAALMYVYENKLEFKSFYKKRFLAIFPMFWMAYIVAVLPRLVQWRNMGFEIPYWRFLLTIIGMDGYLSEFGQGFYVLGEWFLGFIIIFYVVFPLLRLMINKNEVVTWIIILFLYGVTLYFYDFDMSISKILFVRLPELCFGMSFIKHRLKPKAVMVIPAIIILVLTTLINPNIMNSIKTTYVGIAAFIVFVFCSELVRGSVVKRVCAFLSKYSYAIFLVHHVIIEDIQGYFDLQTLSVAKSYVLFFIITIVTLVVAYMLQHSHDSIINNTKSKSTKFNNS